MKTKPVNLNSDTATPIAIKADPELLRIIDELRRKQPDIPSRTQMIIRAIRWAFAHESGEVAPISKAS